MALDDVTASAAIRATMRADMGEMWTGPVAPLDNPTIVAAVNAVKEDFRQATMRAKASAGGLNISTSVGGTCTQPMAQPNLEQGFRQLLYSGGPGVIGRSIGAEGGHSGTLHGAGAAGSHGALAGPIMSGVCSRPLSTLRSDPADPLHCQLHTAWHQSMWLSLGPRCAPSLQIGANTPGLFGPLAAGGQPPLAKAPAPSASGLRRGTAAGRGRGRGIPGMGMRYDRAVPWPSPPPHPRPRPRPRTLRFPRSTRC
jgi:hypothetical protein